MKDICFIFSNPLENMKRVILLLLLMVFVSTSSAQVPNGLIITVTDFTISDAMTGVYDNKTHYSIDGEIEINNPTHNPISFTHADLCRFKLEINISPENVDDIYPFACPEATELIEFQPGITTSNATVDLVIQDGTNILPNGNYTIEVSLNDYQKEKVASSSGISFGVVDNEIADVYYNLEIFTNDDISSITKDGISGQVSISLFSILLAVPLAKNFLRN